MSEINLNLQRGFVFGGWLPEIVSEIHNIRNFINDNVGYEKEYFQFQAFLSGMENAAISNPNPSVGCVIVKNNQIISTGCTQEWGGLHAERVAFKKLEGHDLSGTEVYLTLEPCTHHGRQPPCLELFRNRGIKKVYISRSDLNPVVKNNGIRALQEMGIDVEVGFLEKEVTVWNLPFFIQQLKKRPMVALKWAQSLDGCFADDYDSSHWISGSYSRQYTHWLRQKYDAILVGAGTFLKDTPLLDVRDISHAKKRDPIRIVFDPKASIFFCDKNMQNMLKKNSLIKNTKTLFLINQNMIRDVLSSSSQWCLELNTSANIKILPIKSELNFYSAKDVLDSLNGTEFLEFFGRPLQSIFVEGGPRLLSMFIQDEFFDALHVFTAPFVLGGKKHKLFSNNQKSFKNYSTKALSTVKRWELIAQERLGNDALMEMMPLGRFGELF
jgi:diaminohydroxyphosphoribosylaminopyrimidine deaminase/5-amino-6-(5-phosphoribosylamino)uracil reductase